MFFKLLYLCVLLFCATCLANKDVYKDSLCARAVPQRPHELKLPSELFYASCACADRAQFADIRSRFKMATQGHVRREPACEVRPPNCLVEEVVVGCHREHVTATTLNVDLVCSASRKDATKGPSPTQYDADEGQGRVHHRGDREHSAHSHQHRSHNITIRSAPHVRRPYAGLQKTMN